MLNRFITMGRITNDLELKTTPNGKEVISFNIAVDRDFQQNGQKETDFFPVVAWGATAGFISRYFSKGKLIVIDGRLQVRSWTNKDGEERYTTEVLANAVYFAGDKSENTQSGGNALDALANKAEKMGVDVEYEDVPLDDLPF